MGEEGSGSVASERGISQGLVCRRMPPDLLWTYTTCNRTCPNGRLSPSLRWGRVEHNPHLIKGAMNNSPIGLLIAAF